MMISSSPFFSGKPDNVDVKVAGKFPLFEVLNIVTCLQIKMPLSDYVFF